MDHALATPATSPKTTGAPQSGASFRDRLNEIRTDLKNEQILSYALIFDATGSRESTWNAAIEMQFKLTDLLTRCDEGQAQVQLIAFGGYLAFSTSPWSNDADTLKSWMTDIRCISGGTQMKRAFRHVIAEAQKRKITAIIYVGDMVEDHGGEDNDPRTLFDIAEEIAQLKIPAYLLQEGDDKNASVVFSRVAEITGGKHLSFTEKDFNEMWRLVRNTLIQTSGGRLLLPAGRESSSLKPPSSFLLDARNG